jgi:hypothetical protein
MDTITIRICHAIGVEAGLIADEAVACDALGNHDVFITLIKIWATPQPHLLADVWRQTVVQVESLQPIF